MYNKLLEIYKPHIIKEITKPDTTKYYYFYDSDGIVFGISKSISENEYKLFCSIFLEKKYLNDNSQNEQIFNYLYKNHKCPFTNKTQFIVCSTVFNDIEKNFLKDLFINLEIFEINNSSILFYQYHEIINLKEIFQTLSDDFGRQIFIHVGFIINKTLPGTLLANYLDVLAKSNCLNKDYSNISDLIIENDILTNTLLNSLKELYFNPVLSKNNNYHLLQTFFKCDLNVSKTSKVIYLNRNTIINRIKNLSNEFGFSLEEFKNACLIYIIMNK